jgi:colanic acid biosynthesis glycosyl transferase WcaI
MQNTVLILSQVYVPDPAAVGQCMHEAAAQLAARGNRVVVLTSRRGYADPSECYPSRATLDGVDVRRLPLSSFGKSSILARLIALDSYMASRLNAKVDISEKMAVMPPWSHLNANQSPIAHEDNPFRKKNGFGNRVVIMYSGNISPSHPVTTILDAASKLQDCPQLLFVFIGSGLGRAAIEKAVERDQLQNVLVLPYQPFDQIHFSLSAADVHLVSMGDEMVGIVHPCKVYGAMAVGRPILFLGPRESHVGEILSQADVGWHVAHGDVDAAVARLREISTSSTAERGTKGLNAQELVRDQFDPDQLKGEFCDVVEQGLRRAA